jgi:2-polyprenyl-3-methyl-5-hydroxy-6-metoxy-1,4-benzoquinol methylase
LDIEKIIPSVKQQYEALPYPPRDPGDEKNRLIETIGDNLVELNHCCFQGRKSFNKSFRCLVAGGGTGDSVIYLAEQLRETTAEIYYLDMSEASRQIAQQRAAIRQLSNITWLTESLLSLPQLNIGQFDYINCSGVLHHLHDPIAGLQALTSVLKEDGAIYLMLYAKYGRQSVYLMQALLQEIIPDETDISTKVAIARRILHFLARDHAFCKDLDKWGNEINDSGYGDAGLYDLLLHSTDRCYDVNEIYALAGIANLNVVRFLGQHSRFYDPDNIISDPNIRALWNPKTLQERQAIAEKLFSNHIKHQFYLSHQSSCIASIIDEENALILANELEGKNLDIYNAIVIGETLRITLTVGGEQEVFQLKGNKINKACFRYMDGKTSISSIIRKVKVKTGATEQAVREELNRIFELLHPLSWVYLTREYE